MLPVLFKVVEKHVHASLYNYLCTNNLLYKYQSGFRVKYSTKTALIRLVDQLMFDAYKNTVTVFIDYCKAFDTVNHHVLLHKSEALASITKWSSENKLSINSMKTKTMLFGSKRLHEKMSSKDEGKDLPARIKFSTNDC